MLVDLLTAVIILKARNDVAARQLLSYLITVIKPDDAAFAKDYPKVVLQKACALAGPGAQEWLEGLY